MPMIQTDSQHYSDIADAIRDMSGSSEVFYPADMAGGVRSIPQTIAIAPIIYSLEEREVGVWTDGKPLYQKTVPFNFADSVQNWTLFDDSISYDSIVGAITKLVFSNNNDQVMSYPDRDTSPRFCVKTDHKMYYYTTVTSTGNVTLLYTKTTDTPGSGTWTPSGVPAHHYSTEEQVIGTWTDGKPLYEKTFEFSTSISVGSSWVNTGLTLMNVKYLIHCSGGRGLAVYNVMADMDGNNIELCIPGWSASIKYFTLQYTKTTD